jgi:hypothetical protein
MIRLASDASDASQRIDKFDTKTKPAAPMSRNGGFRLSEDCCACHSALSSKPVPTHSAV